MRAWGVHHRGKCKRRKAASVGRGGSRGRRQKGNNGEIERVTNSFEKTLLGMDDKGSNTGSGTAASKADESKAGEGGVVLPPLSSMSGKYLLGSKRAEEFPGNASSSSDEIAKFRTEVGDA